MHVGFFADLGALDCLWAFLCNGLFKTQQGLNAEIHETQTEVLPECVCFARLRHTVFD
jgi:hypothetical protein